MPTSGADTWLKGHSAGHKHSGPCGRILQHLEPAGYMGAPPPQNLRTKAGCSPLPFYPLMMAQGLEQSLHGPFPLASHLSSQHLFPVSPLPPVATHSCPDKFLEPGVSSHWQDLSPSPPCSGFLP